MKVILKALLFMCFYICCCCGQQATDFAAKAEPFLVFDVEHTLENSNKFMKRGQLKLYSVQGRDDKSNVVVEATGDNQIPTEHMESFKALFLKNDLYKIRIRSNPRNSSSAYVQAAIPVCELQKSGFKEEIVLHLSASNSIVGLAYSSPVGSLALASKKACDKDKLPSSVKMLTKSKVAERSFSNPIPFGALGIKPPNLQAVPTGPADGSEAQPRKSFLAQYWYIIVPIAVMTFLSPTADDKDDAGTSGKKKGGAVAPSSSASSASAST